MQLQNITFEDSQFNLLLNRYEDTNAIAIMIQEVDEDYCEPVTVNMLPDEDEVFENEIDSELVAIPVDSFELVNTLIAYGLIEKGPELVNFFEGVYFYKPTQELINYLDELKEKYNNKDSYLLYYSANNLIEKGIITKEQYAKLETELDKILPTKEGFFFGPIDYALSYFLNVKNTLEMLTKIIDNADFENEVYLYHSSW